MATRQIGDIGPDQVRTNGYGNLESTTTVIVMVMVTIHSLVFLHRLGSTP